MNNKGLPLSLRAIAYICFFYAIWIALDAFVILRNDPFYLSPLGILSTLFWSALNILLGLGLLKLKPSWRILALFCCWLSFILVPIFWVLPLLAPDSVILYERLKSLFDLAISIWTYRVLTRSHIRRLFTA